MTVFWAALFAASVLAFIFPFAIYPFVLLLTPRRHEIGQAPPPAQWPSVTAIVAVFNGADRIAAKIAELRRLDYPQKIEVIVADDGSDDGTAAAAEAAGADRVVRLPERGGKSAAQNAGVAAAAGEALLFTDLAVTVQPDALRLLAAELCAPGVGCVTGVDRSVAAGPADPSAAAGFYTRFEAKMRHREGETGSLLGVNGCLFLVRKELRPPVPTDSVDDLYVPLAVNDRDLRVAVHPAAEAIVPRTRSLREEFRRKARTFAGGLFTLRAARRDLPHAVRRLRGRLWAHKRLRWLGPWLILLALYGSVGLALRWPPGWLFVIVEAAAAGAALAGVVWTAAGGQPPRPLRLAAFLALSQAALVWAWVRFALRRPYVVWRPTRRE